MRVVGKFELFEKVFDPALEGALPTELESSLHPVSLLHWGVLEAFLEGCHRRLELEWVEVVEAGELTVAARELAQDHRRVLEVVAEVLDENVFEAGQVEAILEGRHEKHVCLGPKSHSHVD